MEKSNSAIDWSALFALIEDTDRRRICPQPLNHPVN